MTPTSPLVLGVVGLVVGALFIAAGIVLLVIGTRRHDDSTSRPYLALGITALVLGLAIGFPALLWVLAPLAW